MDDRNLRLLSLHVGALVKEFGFDEVAAMLEKHRPRKRGRPRKPVLISELDDMANLIATGEARGTTAAAGMVLSRRLDPTDARFDGLRRTLVRAFEREAEGLMADAQERYAPRSPSPVRLCLEERSAPSAATPEKRRHWRRLEEAFSRISPTFGPSVLDALVEERLENGSDTKWDVLASLRNPARYAMRRYSDLPMFTRTPEIGMVYEKRTKMR